MTEQYTLAQVVELQQTKRSLEQRLEVHKQRATEKQKELSELYAKYGVQTFEELGNLCAKANQVMQDYARLESQNIEQMKAKCDELDRML